MIIDNCLLPNGFKLFMNNIELLENITYKTSGIEFTLNKYQNKILVKPIDYDISIEKKDGDEYSNPDLMITKEILVYVCLIQTISA